MMVNQQEVEGGVLSLSLSLSLSLVIVAFNMMMDDMILY
jgi:hypothetical protein